MLTEITAILRTLRRDDSLDLTARTRFDEILNWDSVNLVALVVELECRFELSFDLPEIDLLVTVGDLIRLVAAKRTLALA